MGKEESKGEGGGSDLHPGKNTKSASTATVLYIMVMIAANVCRIIYVMLVCWRFSPLFRYFIWLCFIILCHILLYSMPIGRFLLPLISYMFCSVL